MFFRGTTPSKMRQPKSKQLASILHIQDFEEDQLRKGLREPPGLFASGPKLKCAAPKCGGAHPVWRHSSVVTLISERRPVRVDQLGALLAADGQGLLQRGHHLPLVLVTT